MTDFNRVQELSNEIHAAVGKILDKAQDMNMPKTTAFDLAAFICLNHAAAAAVLACTKKEHFVRFAGVLFDEQRASIETQAKDIENAPEALQ